MMRYDTYKPSGIDWLGLIPAQWQVARLKDLAYIVRGGSPRPAGDPRYYGGDIPFLRVADLTATDDIYLNDYKYTITQLGLSNTRLVKGNTLLLTNSGATLGIPKIVSFSTTFNDGIAAFLGIKNSNKVFLYFFLKNKTQWFLNMASLGQGQPNLNTEIIGNTFIGLPPLTEQTTIAQYLDTKTQAIDNKINLLTKKADYYKELRKSIIHSIVSGNWLIVNGKAVPCEQDSMIDGKLTIDNSQLIIKKESGIDWIGKIPEHWKISRIKDSFNLFTGNSISDKGLFERKENSIDYVSTKDIDVDTGRITYDNGVYIPKEDKSFKIAKANSTLICIEGANAGKKIGFTEKDICFVNKLCAIKSKTKNNADKYFYYFTQSPLFEKQFFAILNGLIGGVSLNSIKYFDIISPTKEEQTAIANYLDEKTQKIDAIVSNIGKQIDTLKELRKALINDVVTGEIKVGNN